jgi:hypothetical protein
MADMLPFCQAIELTDDDLSWEAVADWCGGTLVNHRDSSDEYTTELRVPTLDGPTPAFVGWWVVRQPDGTFTTFLPTKAMWS